MANATPTNVGVAINISHIQVLDDTGGLIVGTGSSAVTTDEQGGVINMADFATLQALNTNYDLVSGPLGNLFYVKGGSVLQDPTFAASTDVAPAGYQLLQLLNSDGSTANVLGANLTIADGFTQFAVNMMDVADGWVTAPQSGTPCYSWIGNDSISSTVHYMAQYAIGSVNGAEAIIVDSSTSPYGGGIWNLYSAPLETLTGYNITIFQESPVPLVSVQSHLKLWLADDGVNVYQQAKSSQPPVYVAQGGQGGTPPAPVLIGTIFDAPIVQIENYTTTDIYLPYESVKPASDGGPLQNWVVLGSQDPTAVNLHQGGFTDTPVFSTPLIAGTAATLNFYDNTVDNGGSPPGGPDNLVLGYTNFTGDLAPATVLANYDPTQTIGNVTVGFDATPTATINDFGAGSLEIGATDATNLNAQSTSHLIMDVSAVPQYYATDGVGPVLGITVTGSLLGQNLIQGSFGPVQFDTYGHVAPDFPSSSGNGTGVLEGTALTFDYAVGNDNLTGGTATTGGILNGQGMYAGHLNDAQTWVTGDNYFPEGGIDTVNLSHAASTAGVTAYDAVWVGMFDVSSFITSAGVAPHVVFGQAVTDIVGGVETYVDGYGPSVTQNGLSPEGGKVGASGSNTSLLTINGFIEGNNTGSGDILNFDPQDWAVTGVSGAGTVKAYGTSGINDLGLVTTNSATEMPTTTAHEATTIYVGTSASDGGKIAATGFDVILDGLAGYQNASQLAQALSNADGGDIGFVTGIAAKTTEHMLIAYNNTLAGGVTIDDVTITNISGSSQSATSASGVHISAVDLVQLDGGASNPVATVGSLLHNVYFLHG